MDELWQKPLDSYDQSVQKTDGSPDTEKLRRPMSSFLIYCRQKRPEIRLENPATQNIEITKILATKWKNLSPAEKAPYKEEAQRLLDKFKEDNPEYRYQKQVNPKRRKSAAQASVNVPDPQTLVNMPQEQFELFVKSLRTAANSGQIDLSITNEQDEFYSQYGMHQQ